MTQYYAGTAQLLDFLGLTSADATALGLSNQQMIDALDRAAAEIDQSTKTHFATGTTTPDYVAVSNEKQDGQGKFNRWYFTEKYPIPDLKPITSGTVNANAGTVEVSSTAGFPSSGVIGASSYKITYTSKAGTAFLGCSGNTGTISPSTTVTPYVVEISTSDSGDDITWQIMNKDTEYDLDTKTGRVFLYKNYIISSYYTTDNPPRLTPNRFRITYLYGWDAESKGLVPYEITRLCLMIASKELLHRVVRSAYLKGFNNFNPSMIEIDKEYIEQTLNRYKNPMVVNV